MSIARATGIELLPGRFAAGVGLLHGSGLSTFENLAPRSADHRIGDQRLGGDEVASALAMKVRMRVMTSDEHDAALQAFRELSRSFEVRMVSRNGFRTAARFCRSYAVGLRSGHALNLAICHEASDTLCTLDQRLAAAAKALGVATSSP